jgi:hypothetical protein
METLEQFKEVEKQCSAFVSFRFSVKWNEKKYSSIYISKKILNERAPFFYWNEYITSDSRSILEHFKVKLSLSESIYSMRRVEGG